MATLYEDAGGMEGLRRLSGSFYQRVLADPLLAPVFASFTPTHVGMSKVTPLVLNAKRPRRD